LLRERVTQAKLDMSFSMENAMTNSTKWIHLAGLVFAALLTLGGCAADSADGPDDMGSEGVGPVELGDEGIPGEDPDAPRVDKARNCVYVQWCDQPNSSIGTVCRTYRGCTVTEANRQEFYRECDRDVQSVCGGPTLPMWFYPW
jgi:hypothetical protein